jgi:hypothetical protein
MNEARVPAQCRVIMPPATTTLPDPDALARKLAEILGGAPDRALAERLLALCRVHLAAARPCLERADPSDTPDQHMAALRELARHG